MYESYIIDELGDIVCKCLDYSEDKIMEMLLEHPEWQRKCISINNMF